MKIWRIICIMASLITLFFWTGMGSLQAAGVVNITVDGTVMKTDVPPFIDENARTMVPVRFVSEALGCHVNWNATDQRVRISRPGTIVDLHINRKMARVNNAEQELDTAAVLTEGRTMVPLRFLAETFGLQVNWNNDSRTVAIKSPPPPPTEQGGSEPRQATVSGNNVNIRPGPGTNYDPPLTQVSTGTRLTILAEEGEWFQVALPSGVKGWIIGQYVDFSRSGSSGAVDLRGLYAMPSDASRTALVMKPSVNVRSSPGVDYPTVGRVTLGQKLPILGEQNNWLSVRLPDGQRGWIAGWLVAVQYDRGTQQTPADRNVATGLISRWSGAGESLSGDLPIVTAMDAERSDNGVLLTIKANSPLELPHCFRMDSPSRLVFDFKGQLGEKDKTPTLEVNHGAVNRFRLGQFDERTVRVVADLGGPVSYALTQGADGKTVTIQIRPVDPSGQTIVIDPGHGTLNQWGFDPGAIGRTGLTEREVVLSISLQLGNILLNEGYSVIYTNEINTGLALDERSLVGSISGAELLVSVHANAHTNRSVAGTMTFYHAPSSRVLAGFLQTELVNRLQRENKGVRQANFLVLRSCPIPAALVEVAFISNPEEERLLADPAFQRKAAEAIALGIKRYLAAR